MTHKEAIEYLIDPIGKGLKAHEEAIKIAVDAILKQIPREPLRFKTFNLCPNCHRSEYIQHRDAVDTYCGFCGQAIDWCEVENGIENDD